MQISPLKMRNSPESESGCVRAEGQRVTQKNVKNKGLRSGYLLCQSDHAGSYIYDKVLGETKDKDKAAAASQSIGQHRKNGGNQ